jgi:DNA-binding CsgD family transcriptional regulator/tetratricopeptide (TPR) repeat protein
MGLAKKYFIAILFVLVQAPLESSAQKQPLPIHQWAQLLSVKEDYRNVNYRKVYYGIINMPLPLIDSAIDKMKAAGDTDNKRFDIRIHFLRAHMYMMKNGWSDQNEWSDQNVINPMLQCLHEAYQLEDNRLVEQISDILGHLFALQDHLPESVFYLLNAVKIQDKLGEGNGFMHYLLGNQLFYTGEYKECIQLIQEALQCHLDTLNTFYPMNAWHTMGLAYKCFDKYDSALYAFAQSMKVARQRHDTVWYGIISGSMGEVYFDEKKYDTAKQLLLYNYSINKKSGQWDVAAFSLQWASRIALAEGKKDSALNMAKEALQMLNEYHKKNYVHEVYYGNTYRQETFYSLANAYLATGKTDSFQYYFQLYANLRDSLQTVAALSRTQITQMKLDDLQNRFKISDLEKEEETERLKRNFIIGIISLFTVIALLFLNRQRIKSNYTKQLALQQKEAAEAEVVAAKEQMNLFTQNIIEKTNLIEKLEQQLHDKTLSAEQQQLIAELSHQTILTEDDWEQFKTLFEKIYPGFFISLKEKVSDITAAEQRMASLIRLHLSSRQMASMLGISPNSVNKTKQRLRQRLNGNHPNDLEELIATL